MKNLRKFYVEVISKLIRIVKYLSWNFAGNFSQLFVQWIIPLLISKIGDVRIAGEYVLALSIISPLLILSQMQHRWIITTDTNEFSYKTYISLRVILTLVLVVLLVVLILIYYDSYSLDYLFLLLFVGLVKGSESVADIIYGNFQQQGKIDLVGKRLLIKSITFIIIIFLGLSFGYSLWKILCSYFILMFIFLCFFELRPIIALQEIFYVNLDHRKLLFKSFPLALSALIATLNVSLPRYFAGNQLDLKELGYFSIAAMPIALMTFIPVFAMQALMGNLSKKFHEQKILIVRNQICQITGIFLLANILIFICLLLGAPLIIKCLFNTEKKYFSVLLLLSMSSIVDIVGNIGTTTLHITRQYSTQLNIIIVSLILITIGNYIFIPLYGLISIGYVELIKSIVSTILYTAVFVRTFYYKKYVSNL